MEKLDRLVWTAGLVVVSYGVRIGIRTNDPEVLERVRAALPPACDAADGTRVSSLFSLRVGGEGSRPGTRHFHLLYTNSARVARTHDLDDVLVILEREVRMWIAEHAHRRVFVHAGVVAWKGRALLLPGLSFSGKTTLVTALMQAGAECYSDEYAVLDSKGLVHAYPRPMSIRLPAGGVEVRPLSGGPRPPLEVGVVALCKYEAGAQWKPRRLSRGQAALGLLANALPARYNPVATMKALQRVAASAVTVRGKRGEAEEVAHALLALMDETVPRRRGGDAALRFSVC